VRIGIANPVTRHPAVLAMEAATLAEIAGPDRLAFGVGAAVWTMRALGYEPPAWQPYTNVVETVRAMRRWLEGDELGFTPTTFRADRSNRLDFVPTGPIRIDIGAVNGRMMEAAGELADGVQLGALVSPGYVRWSRERLAQARPAHPATSTTCSCRRTCCAASARSRAGTSRRARGARVLPVARRGASSSTHRAPIPTTSRRCAPPSPPRAAAAGANRVSEHLIDTFAVRRHRRRCDRAAGGVR
jgi:5,10-methylenetetrahydromethanopterin reductase